MHKHIFHENAINYFVKNIKFFLIYILDLVGSYYLVTMFDINNLLIWFIFYIAYTIINGIIIIIIFKIFNETTFIKRIKEIRGRI